MEESELQSLRTDSSSQAKAHLSNPLAHPAPPPAAEGALPAPRLEFYDDRIPVLSGSKQSSGGGYNPLENFPSPIRSASPMPHPSSNQPSAGPRSYYMAAPAHQFQVNQSPHQCSYGMPPHFPQSASWRSPVPFAGPFSGPEVTPVVNHSVWNRSGGGGGSSGHGFPPNSSRGGSMSPGFGRGSPICSSGGTGPHNLSRRGRGGWGRGTPSPNSEQAGGRGWASYGRGSARQEAEHFDCKSIVDDPWRGLEPIVGNILVPLAGLDFWLPKSVTAKKAKIAETGKEFSPQLSLAECLALSFEEAINDANP